MFQQQLQYINVPVPTSDTLMNSCAPVNELVVRISAIGQEKAGHFELTSLDSNVQRRSSCTGSCSNSGSICQQQARDFGFSFTAAGTPVKSGQSETVLACDINTSKWLKV